MINYYEHPIMKKYLDSDEWNPYRSKHNISLDKSLLFLGPSGAGKTNCLMNLLSNMNNTFRTVTVYVDNPDEPMYNCLKDQGCEILSLTQIRPVKDLPKQQQLVIFDDWIELTKKQMLPIEAYATKGRKKLCTMCYLTQDYYSVPTKLRNQIRYLLILKITNKKNLKMICSGLPIDCDVKTLVKVINYCTEEQFNICIVDKTDAKKCLRKNFDEFIEL